ncbi:MAG: DUF6364 family protein [Candidatus Anammoxibacter sp.]
MNTKLTLKLDSEIISEAKSYAKFHSSSLSKLVETFLKKLTNEDDKNATSPLVQELSGIIEKGKLPDETERYKYLMGKYS